MNPEGPASTLPYMIAGYVVIFGVLIGYLTSLVLRRRRYLRELEFLRELENEDPQQSSHHHTVG